MTHIIGAPTIDAALRVLSSVVEEGEARGEQITVFCEDKLTLLAERAAVGRSKGSFSTEVTTFARFLRGEETVLSKQGSVMAVAALLEEYRTQLTCFKRSAAQAVYETIAQLLSSRADEKMLRDCAAETEGMLSRKLSDLALILEKYREFLRERGLVDENGYLALLPERIGERLGGRHIVFFAFPSFTRQAAEGIRAAVSTGERVTGIFLTGEGVYTNEAYTVFRRVAEELGPVQTVRLQSDLKGDAAFLAERLFLPEAYALPAEGREHIHLFRARDEGEELETVCALIRRYVAEEGLRFRDFAVLLPDNDRFLQTERTLSDYHIPFFSDRKRPFSEHPFCRFVRDVLLCVHDGGRPESADAVLSSVYFGQADGYRNYLLKFGGYRGAISRQIKEGDAVKGFDREELVAARERLRAILALFPREGRGEKYIEAVRALYELVGAEAVTESLCEKFEGAEREFLDVSPFFDVLSEVGSMAGGQRFTAREFSDLLTSGLTALEIAMIPQSADAVFLGDATESRFCRVRVLFLLGADESLPRVSADTAVLPDGELKRLERLSLEIEPQIGVVNARARESLYLNLCAFDGDLFVGCPLRVKGEEARRGEAFLSISHMTFGTPMPEISLYKCCERGPSLRELLRLKEEYGRGESESGRAFAALREMLEKTEDLSSLFKEEKMTADLLPSLLFRGQISPSLLESYFACPYQSFLKHGLRVREREERSVLDTDTGSFVHAVLEAVAPQFNEIGSEEACRALAEEKARELLASPRYAFLTDTGAGAYTGGRLVQECGAVTAACYRQVHFSTFRVEATEREISLPAIGLKGRTDRVDVSDGLVRIIDYKTGEIDDRPSAYYTGRKLQLQLYLLAASEGKRPVGAFYFPAQEGFTNEDEPFRMKGFFDKDDDVLARMDTLRTEGKSAFFEGGGRSEKGLSREDFSDFLSYSLLVSAQAIGEMKEGYIAPSPYEGTCKHCKFKGICGFCGEERKESSVTCAQIAAAVRTERGEE